MRNPKVFDLRGNTYCIDTAVVTPGNHGSKTISAKMITEMRGADFIVFRINENGKLRNLMRFYFFE